MTHEAELNADALALIEAARGGHDPAPGVQARVRHQLQLSITAGVGVAGDGALASASSGKLLAAALAVGLAGSGVWYAEHHASRHAQPSAVHSNFEPSLAAPELSALPVTPTPAEPALPAPLTLPVHTQRAAPAHLALAHSDSSSDLAAETRVLSLVNAALQRHDGSAALSLLSEYDQRFKSRLLFAERSAARVFALCTLGNSAAATAEAARFVRSFPRSPLVSRVEASCARSPAKPPAP